MTYADGFIISILALSVLFAWLRGLSRELITLVAIAAGAAAIYLLGTAVGGVLGEGAIKAAFMLGLLFLVTFTLVTVILEIVVSTFLGKTPRLQDKIAGAVFGLIRGWLILGLAYVTATYYFPEDDMPPAIENATLKSVAISAAGVLESLGLEREYAGDETIESSDISQTDQ